MHEPSLGSPPAASTEAPTDPNDLDALFGPETDTAPAPELLCEVISEITALSPATPPTVAAVVLATLGAALGPRVTLHRTRQRCCPGINVVVTHRCPRTLPWVDAVTAPFVGRVFERQADLIRHGVPGTERANEHRRQGLAQARGTVRPDADLLARLQAEAEQSAARLKPFVAASGVAPKELADLLPRAFDHGVTLVTAGNDPVIDLQRLRPGERAHLAQLLDRSWVGTPLTFGSTVFPGHLHLLWSSRRPIEGFLGPVGFDTAAVSLPFLIFSDESGAAPLPEFAHELRWDQLIGHLFDCRCVGQPKVFTLHPDAEAVLTAFGQRVAGASGTVPEVLRPHVAWLPELAARVALIYWVAAGRDDPIIDAEMATAAMKMTKWISRQHVATLAAAILVDDAAPADNQAKLLAKIRAKAPVSRRDLRRCFDNQRIRWFDAALDTLLEDKKVRYNDDALLVPCT